MRSTTAKLPPVTERPETAREFTAWLAREATWPERWRALFVLLAIGMLFVFAAVLVLAIAVAIGGMAALVAAVVLGAQ